MPARKFVYSYNQFSNGAKELANAIPCKRIKHHGSNYQPRPGDVVIRWGGGGDRVFPDFVRVLNPTNVVKRASNKLAFFQHCDGKDVRIPDWTTSRACAEEWVQQGHVVVARTVLGGHSGEGIVIIENPVDFVDAPLYTKYVKKEQEYRVHCFKTGNSEACIIDLQRKIKRPDFVGEPNWRVRNHQNGFIYVRNNVNPPEDVKVQALAGFTASGLDFGAVDVIWNAHLGQAYVLEINTAPGLSGQTIESYASKFRQL